VLVERLQSLPVLLASPWMVLSRLASRLLVSLRRGRQLCAPAARVPKSLPSEQWQLEFAWEKQNGAEREPGARSSPIGVA
jgi:hypothetical protein